jgi:hypothetical protein
VADDVRPGAGAQPFAGGDGSDEDDHVVLVRSSSAGHLADRLLGAALESTTTPDR